MLGRQNITVYSGAPLAWRATKRSPINSSWERKGNQWVDFLMVIMASGIARGRVCTTKTTESPNMAPIKKLTETKPWFTVYFFDIGQPCYDQLTPVNTGYPLTTIVWPYRGSSFCCFLLCIGWLLNWKQKLKQYTKNLSAKLQNSNQNSTFSWVSLIRFWTTWAKSYAFRLA